MFHFNVRADAALGDAPRLAQKAAKSAEYIANSYGFALSPLK
jgi:hypothetical protein